MKKLLLLTSLLTSTAFAECFTGEDSTQYQESLVTAYIKFADKCALLEEGGCFPIVPVCERKYLVCFEQKLNELEAKYQCRESAALVELATHYCLRPIVPIQVNR
jgi:hypothetical protein